MRISSTKLRGDFLWRFTTYACAFFWLLAVPAASYAQSSDLVWLNGGSLEYAPFAMEQQTNAVNVIPDYSHAGYMGGGVAIPTVPTVITLSPSGTDDDTPYIQAAIDSVEALSPDANGFRGAVLLLAGCYEVDQLFIEQSGVVLRGEGQSLGTGTILKANLEVQHDFIALQGSGSGFELDNGSQQDITTPYVPLGSYSFEIEDASDYSIGDTIVLRRTPNQFWIDDLEMGQWGWTPSSYAIFHERIITDISGNTLTINVPIVDVIEDQYGGGEVFKASVPGRISHCGVENLRIVSHYDELDDEEHAWVGVELRRVTDSWVKNVTGQFLGFGVVNITSESNFNTIQDCAVIDPRSTLAGGRRYSFNITDGMGNLFQRNYARQGRHDYATGSRVTGPNVFLDNYAEIPTTDIGPHHRWATGLLFDNIRGEKMRVRNREGSGSGHGWAGNTTMFWNLLSVAEDIWVESPKGGQNWGIGCEGTEQIGDGYWEHWNNPVLPRSLYLQQLEDRLGPAAVANITIPEQLDGTIYDMLANWAGGGGFDPGEWDAILEVSEDAYVRGGNNSDNNYGAETRLNIKNSGEGHSNTRRTFLRFDLSDLPSTPIYNIRLRLYVANDAPNPTQDALYHVPDDSWSEETITYANQPEIGDFIDTMTVQPNGDWVEYEITDLVNNELAGDGILSLRVSAFAEGANLHGYAAKEEGGAFVPNLAYDFTPEGPPEYDPCIVITTGTESPALAEADEAPAFTLMPNPVQDVLRVDFSHASQAEDMLIFSTTGELMRILVKPRGIPSLEIPVADLPRGLYLLRMGRHTEKFIKL